MTENEIEVPRKESIVSIITVVFGLITACAFMVFCLFLLVLISHDFPTAKDFIIEGNRVPQDIYDISILVVLASLALGIKYGFRLWEVIFIRFGLIPRSNWN